MQLETGTHLSGTLFSSINARNLYGLQYYLFLRTRYKTFSDLGARNFYGGTRHVQSSPSKGNKQLFYGGAVTANLNRLLLRTVTGHVQPSEEEIKTVLGFEEVDAQASTNISKVLDNFFYVELSTSRKLSGSQRSVLGLAKLPNHNYDFYSTVFTDFKYINAYRTELQSSPSTATQPLLMAAHGQAPERLKRVLFGSDDRLDDRYFGIRRSPKKKKTPEIS